MLSPEELQPWLWAQIQDFWLPHPEMGHRVLQGWELGVRGH